MFIIYNDEDFFIRKKNGGMTCEPDDTGFIMKCWETHLNNWYQLNFIARNSVKFLEKQQAEKELRICLKKMKFWEKFPGFSVDIAGKKTDNQKRIWNSKRNPS